MLLKLMAAVLTAAISVPVAAAVDVFACEPEWAALVQEIGGDRVRVRSATTALQDPHRIQARPSLIARMRKADLVVCTGADLEIGWLPLLLRKANNPRVRPGKPGYLEAADHVDLLDRPQRLDRADGDVHAAGNPHIQTSPYNIAAVAPVLAERLAQIDAGASGFYAEQLADFLERWQAAIARWENRAAPLRGMQLVVQHRSWVYLRDWLGMDVVATIEPKPGLPPSGAHLAQLVADLEHRPATAIVRAAYQDDHGTHWLSERTGLPVVVLPFTVGGSERARDLFAFFDATIELLLDVIPGS